ncbi:hypothetical protein P3L10_010162 [Capsicum annuum]|uniref:uncharacterized protein LOC107866288 n=1 Tax=Capsicum annuum TaxID=4072 RepID=UPI0007BF578B|nr:uncharacterized protein LOC107866288 [Capsicum annuum]
MKEKVTKVELTTTAKNLDSQESTKARPIMPAVLKGVNYQFWSLKMKTLFKSQELWHLVENGFRDPDEGHTRLFWENRRKDSKELFLIQQALYDDIFPRISAAEKSNEAWEILH